MAVLGVKPLPPPTQEERDRARAAAAALRSAIANPDLKGKPASFHADFGRPRRGVWYTTWPGVPGLQRVACSHYGTHYEHECLPGWTYTRREILREMIPDLEALAERGERPTTATTMVR